MTISASSKKLIRKKLDKLKWRTKVFYTLEVFFILGLLLPRFSLYDIALFSVIISIGAGLIYWFLKYFIPIFYADSPPSKLQHPQVASTNPPSGHNSFKLVGLIIFIGSLVIVIAIGMFKVIKKDKQTNIDSTVIEINSVTKLLKVKQVYDDLFIEEDMNTSSHQNEYRNNFSQIVGKAKPSSQFIITIVDTPDKPAYLFDSEMYTTETGGSLGKIPTSHICQFIEQEIEYTVY